MKFTRYILGSLLLAGCLSLASCKDDILPDEKGTAVVDRDDDDMVDVTISLSLDGIESNPTRDDQNPLKNIDLLIYSVRDENGNVLYQYGRGVLDDDLWNTAAFKHFEEKNDYNQTLMRVGWRKKDGVTGRIYEMADPDGKPMKITLRVMRNTVFKLSIWAQSTETDAYDFNDLTKVEVKYTKSATEETDDNIDIEAIDDIGEPDNNKSTFYPNNDPLRDAFCATSIFSIGQVDSDVSVTLTRPFALIKVGVKEDAGDAKYTKSSITLGGVAKYFNVVENRTCTDQEAEEENSDTVTFDFADFPEGEDAEFIIRDYSKWGTNGPEEITYKTISMCYVLVPEIDYNRDDVTGGYIENGSADGKDDGSNESQEGEKWVKDKEGNSLLFTYNQENQEWTFVKALDSDGKEIADYEYDPENIVADDVVYPGEPNEQKVTLNLLSLSLSDGKTTIKHSPFQENEKGEKEALKISVRRNWRSNLLFDSWGQITNNAN